MDAERRGGLEVASGHRRSVRDPYGRALFEPSIFRRLQHSRYITTWLLAGQRSAHQAHRKYRPGNWAMGQEPSEETLLCLSRRLQIVHERQPRHTGRTPDLWRRYFVPLLISALISQSGKTRRVRGFDPKRSAFGI